MTIRHTPSRRAFEEQRQAEIIRKTATIVIESSADDGATFGADVDFNQHQGIEFVMENRTSDPGSPVTGQLWIRTDL